MENPYAAYYPTQAGNGISGFTGTRFQRVHGFFGRIFSGILFVLKYSGRQSLSTGVSVAQDALKGDNLKETVKTSLKRRAADTFANIADNVLKRARTYAQTGSELTRKKSKRRTSKTLHFNQTKKKAHNKKKIKKNAKSL